jgi:hypothetical protein
MSDEKRHLTDPIYHAAVVAIGEAVDELTWVDDSGHSRGAAEKYEIGSAIVAHLKAQGLLIVAASPHHRGPEANEHGDE